MDTRSSTLLVLALCHVHACAVLQGGPVASPGLLPVTLPLARCSPPPGACGVAWRATKGWGVRRARGRGRLLSAASFRTLRLSHHTSFAEPAWAAPFSAAGILCRCGV